MNFKKTYSNYIALINIIIFIIIFLYDSSITTHTLIKFGAKSNFSIVDFQIFRLLTPMFLHVNFYHLLFNSIALYIIGNQVENIMGKKKFLIIYFISGIIGTMGSFIANDYVAAGASAGIFGLMGTHVYLFLYNRKGYKKYFGNDFLILIGINIVYGLINQNIDNAAHIFGLVGGIIVTLYLGRQIPSFKINQKTVATGTIIAILLLFGIRFNAYKYSGDYYLHKSIYEIRNEDLEAAYHLLIEGLQRNPDDEDLIDLYDLFILEKN
ncbi:MAG: rhomboid family intramembrane serine protease [Bacillota bacterium]|nr:rhomboid family intramembrane serine protease [Bacillota bacterium]